MPERRTTPRKKFVFYMRVLNDDTQEILGHMVEVGADGLQLETTMPSRSTAIITCALKLLLIWETDHTSFLLPAQNGARWMRSN